MGIASGHSTGFQDRYSQSPSTLRRIQLPRQCIDWIPEQECEHDRATLGGPQTHDVSSRFRSCPRLTSRWAFDPEPPVADWAKATLNPHNNSADKPNGASLLIDGLVIEVGSLRIAKCPETIGTGKIPVNAGVWSLWYGRMDCQNLALNHRQVGCSTSFGYSTLNT